MIRHEKLAKVFMVFFPHFKFYFHHLESSYE